MERHHSRQRESARLGFGAMIAEAYTALKTMLEEEERSRSQANAKDTDLPYEMAEDRYDGTTEGGAEQNTLSTCGNRTAKDKAEIPIADSESRVRRFRARQPQTQAETLEKKAQAGLARSKERRPRITRSKWLWTRA